MKSDAVESRIKLSQSIPYVQWTPKSWSHWWFFCENMDIFPGFSRFPLLFGRKNRGQQQLFQLVPGGASFKKANGVGSVHLKCEARDQRISGSVDFDRGRCSWNHETWVVGKGSNCEKNPEGDTKNMLQAFDSTECFRDEPSQKYFNLQWVYLFGGDGCV